MSTTEIRYGSGSVNHDRVRLAMRKVGDQLEAERVERVAVEHAEIRARGGRLCSGIDRRTGQPCEWEARLVGRCQWHPVAVTPPRHDYGPHRPEDAPTTVEVWMGRPPMPVLAAVHDGLARQRAQINGIAHAASQARRSATTHQKENAA